jgi:hypothetical protein
MTRPVTLLTLGGLLGLAGMANAQTVTFAPIVTYTTGGTNSQPEDLAVADVNGDGKLDVVTANSGNGTVGVLLGTGTGTFQAAVTYSAGAAIAPVAIAIADVNGDGKPDVLTANSNIKVGVLLGNGNGTFQSPVQYPVGYSSFYPYDIAVADVNGDSKPDILTVSNGSEIEVLLGNGNGTFQPYTAYSTGTNSISLTFAVADVNTDGKPDVVTANGGSYTAGVLLGTGTGTGSFQPVVQYPTGIQPMGIAIADVNGDAKPDVVTANTSFMAGVLLGNGNGTFQPVVTYSLGTPTTGYPQAIAVADMNKDGKPDLISANHLSSTVSLILGNGNGTFQPPTSYSAGATNLPYRLAVADMNGDSRPDILVANYNGNGPSNTIGILLNSTILAARATLPGTTATLHPNPAGAATTLSVAGLPAAVAQVRATLFDALGRAVGQQQLAATQGAARAEVPTAGLAAGLYVLRIGAFDAQGQPVGNLPTQHLSVR